VDASKARRGHTDRDRFRVSLVCAFVWSCLLCWVFSEDTARCETAPLPNFGGRRAYLCAVEFRKRVGSDFKLRFHSPSNKSAVALAQECRLINAQIATRDVLDRIENPSQTATVPVADRPRAAIGLPLRHAPPARV